MAQQSGTKKPSGKSFLIMLVVVVGCGALACVGVVIISVSSSLSKPAAQVMDATQLAVRDATSIASQIATIDARNASLDDQQGGASGNDAASQPQPAASPIVQPNATVTFDEIRAKNKELTGVKWREYTEQTQGKWADQWTGWVSEVSDSNGYRVSVDMDSPDELLSIYDVSFPADKDTAFKLNKNQRITFSGLIVVVRDVMGVRVEMEQVRIDSYDSASAQPAPAQQPQTKLGDVVEVNGYTLSAVQVEDPATVTYGGYDPKPGTKLVAVEVIVGNTSNPDPLNVNPLHATLVDMDGFTYQPTLASRDGQIDLADLQPGEKKRGWVGFEVPPDAKVKSIKWSVNMFDPEGTLQVGLEQ